MKKSILILTAAIISSTGFIGCMKKGEGDPGISLHTRKARVVGEWKVSAGSGSSTNSSAVTTTWTYADPTYTETDPSGTTTMGLTITYTFEKDGTWKSVQTQTQTILTVLYTSVITTSGKWNFTAGVGEGKKKTQLVLFTESDVSSLTIGTGAPTTTTNTYTGVGAPTQVNDIYQLKNKEMIIKWNSTTTNTPGTATSDSGEFTMVQ